MEETEKSETVNEKPQTFGTTVVNIPNEYKPISMWGYFGYELLFMIPCVGFIILCVFAFGGTSNVNLKNFARSYFCFLIISLVIFAIVFLLLMMAGVSIGGFSGIGSGLGGGVVEKSASAMMP